MAHNKYVMFNDAKFVVILLYNNSYLINQIVKYIQENESQVSYCHMGVKNMEIY